MSPACEKTMLAPSRRRTWRRRGLRIAAIGLSLWVASWGLWEAALRVVPCRSATPYPRGTTIIEDRDGVELAAFVGQEDAWYVPLRSGEIPLYMKQAIVAVEDRRFAEHHGVDWRAVAGAAWEDATSLRIRRGASTLSMQVVRLRDPRPRGWLSKLAQAFDAEQLELHASKDQILTEYLNRAPFGGNLVGVGAASWRYFGKACRDLSLGQAALLAGLPQSPNRFRPDRFPLQARQRRQHVLAQMLSVHAISPEDYARAYTEPVDAAWRPLPQQATHAAWGGLPATAALALAHPGGRVRTTLDAAVQETTWRALSEHMNSLASGGIDSAAVVIVDVLAGQVLATVSRSDSAPGLDLTRRPRSTGSVLKPFLYASAFEMGVLSPASGVLDSPRAWAGYVPANFDKDFHGNMTAAEALAQSRNIPAMAVLARVGIERALGQLAEMGIRTPAASGRPYGLSLAIGGAEATPLELAEAYATLARGGMHVPLALDGGAAAPRHLRVLPEGVCWETLGCLSGRARTEAVDGAGGAARLGVAWKTGTSNGLRDAWCAAATPRRVVVVWLGNAAGHGSANLIGQEAAAPLALQLIARVDPGGEPWPLPQSTDAVGKVLAGSSKLSVVSPAAGTEVLMDANTGEGHRRVALKCAGGSGRDRWWFANGALVGIGRQEQVVWWTPREGNYEVRVVDESGAGAAVRMSVR